MYPINLAGAERAWLQPCLREQVQFSQPLSPADPGVHGQLGGRLW